MAIRLITNEQHQACRCVSGFPACRLDLSSRNPKVMSGMAAPAPDLWPPLLRPLSGRDQDSHCRRLLRRLLAASWYTIARNQGRRRISATAGQYQRTAVADAPAGYRLDGVPGLAWPPYLEPK